MLPPTLHLAAPRALAITTSHLTSAAVVSLAPAAYNVALQLSNRSSNLQVERARHFHWFCRRSPRRYSSWNRSTPSPNPIDGTEQRPKKADNQAKGESEPVVERDEFFNTREKMWKMRREMIERFMNKDPYEGLFGPSNRMLKGLDWRWGPYSAEWKRLWEQQTKEFDLMRSEVKQRMEGVRAQLEKKKQHAQPKEQASSMKYPEQNGFLDGFLGKERGTEQVLANQGNKGNSIKDGWAYDAISNRMVPNKPTNIQESHEWVEIPVKPFEPKVRISTKKDDAKPISKTTEGASSSSISADTFSVEGLNESQAHEPTPAPKPRLPENDEDLLTADDVRARMGHLKEPQKMSAEQEAEKRSQLEAQFDKMHQTPEEPIARPAIQHAVPQRTVEESALWKLQREQLKEAAKDFQEREKKARKALREYGDLRSKILADIMALRQQCEELAKRGTLTLIPRDFQTLQATLDADAKVQATASNLIAAAVLSAPKVPATDPPEHMEPSLDRYAWNKRPFAKIRDAEQLIENIHESMANVREGIGKCKSLVEKKVKMAGKLNDEVERQRRAMRGIEEKWHKRNDRPQESSPAVQEQANKDVQLEKEIRGIYEDRYGAITTKHRQERVPMHDPALSALEEQVNIGKNDAQAAETALDLDMSLGVVPDLPPASLDGGPELETLQPKAQHVSEPASALQKKVSASLSSPSKKPWGMPIQDSPLQDSPPSYYPTAVGRTSAIETSSSETQAHEPEAAAGPFYSTKLQSPTTSTFQGLRPKRVEPVFSGSRGGHEQYEKLRRYLKSRTIRRRYRRFVRRRAIKKLLTTAALLALSCYLAGVVSEFLRDGDERQEKYLRHDADYRRLRSGKEH
ncbi:hypothetical protein NA57DRAFT_80681 [Rhizodiscina lignyota]|uniref:Uncharacterized protein n=1 Tax=Rhizodiscina lignyota TaxID=1504668 RepID=A0A9P4M287_9PEZI|nr:hypothetical protein NA57DRAFT_80681 [Rhizodiscina lignyota]